MKIGVVGAGKARGVTTIALALGAAIGDRGDSCVVIEADLAGGDVGYWRELRVNDHGVLEAAAAMGTTSDLESKVEAINTHAWVHPEAPDCAVLPLVAGGTNVETQVAALWGSGQVVFGSTAPFVFDFGRWSSHDRLTAQMWGGVDAGVVVIDGSYSGLKRAVALARSTPMSNQFPTWIVVNGSPWELDEIRVETNLAVDQLLSWDQRAAEAIRTGSWKRARRTLLGRQIADLGADLVSSMVAGGQR